MSVAFFHQCGPQATTSREPPCDYKPAFPGGGSTASQRYQGLFASAALFFDDRTSALVIESSCNG